MEAFKKHGIVPDVIDHEPDQIAVITYKSGVSANLGDELTPTLVKDQPHVTWNAEPDAYYTVILTDPDAPSRATPKFREWHHWMVVNVPGSDISKGEVKSGYVGSGPPQGTGLHRYVFLVYKQHGKQDFSSVPTLTNRSGDGRASWSARNFAKKNNLGEKPVAANFYQAQWDDYVPKLYEQLKG